MVIGQVQLKGRIEVCPGEIPEDGVVDVDSLADEGDGNQKNEKQDGRQAGGEGGVRPQFIPDYADAAVLPEAS